MEVLLPSLTVVKAKESCIGLVFDGEVVEA